MSQHRRTLGVIEEQAGLKGKILRPLSAKLLPPIEVEKKGFVNREKLLVMRAGQERNRSGLLKN
jgi:hypothetical protein